MTILGIETSCDETAIAVLEQKEGRTQILSNTLASSLELQSNFGGVFPEQAAREQLKSIIPVLDHALIKAFPKISPEILRKSPPIDAIAVTQGPGLIGSLLIGVETAKTLSIVWNKPLIPINHLAAHFYANWATDNVPTFPSLGLLVSGGHTDIVLFEDHNKYIYLGGTRDDAAGECFDKCARLIGLPYPGGPKISIHAKLGDAKTYKLPRPMYSSPNLDMSFSGLKTAAANLVKDLTHDHTVPLTPEQINNLSASIEATICQVLVKKITKALSKYPVNLMVAGGVAANQTLRTMLQTELTRSFPDTNLFIPPINLCTDNGVSTATAGFFNKAIADPLDLEANPNLSLQLTI